MLHLPHLLPLPLFALFIGEGGAFLMEQCGLGGLIMTAGGTEAEATYCGGIDGIGGALRSGIGGRAVALRSGTEREATVVCDVPGRGGDS